MGEVTSHPVDLKLKRSVMASLFVICNFGDCKTNSPVSTHKMLESIDGARDQEILLPFKNLKFGMLGKRMAKEKLGQ
jgi:hypothetical protein